MDWRLQYSGITYLLFPNIPSPFLPSPPPKKKEYKKHTQNIRALSVLHTTFLYFITSHFFCKFPITDYTYSSTFRMNFYKRENWLKLLQPQKVAIEYQTTFEEDNSMYSYRMNWIEISVPVVLLYGRLHFLAAFIQSIGIVYYLLSQNSIPLL